MWAKTRALVILNPQIKFGRYGIFHSPRSLITLFASPPTPTELKNQIRFIRFCGSIELLSRHDSTLGARLSNIAANISPLRRDPELENQKSSIRFYAGKKSY